MKSAWYLLIPVAFATFIESNDPRAAVAQSAPPTVTEAQATQQLSDKDLEVLVARIALYPDELVALVSAASLYPLQIIEADRFLTDSKTKKDLKPKPDWDGSVVSLLNYPEIVHMMSEDLDWTKLMGDAIVNQQDGVLAAIQQLREKALAEKVIKSDDKMTVTEDEENIVIAPASKEVIYVPQYPPEMLYEDDYIYEPVTYYPEPYPYYYSPVAPFFAGAITGAFWAAIVDWDDGFWGGDWDWNDGWHGGDIDIDCNKCIIGGDFNGKINIKDVDWSNIDRSKINFDRTQLDKLDRASVKDRVKGNDRNRVRDKPGDLAGNRPSTLPAKGSRPVKDVRASTLEGLKKQGGPKPSTLPGKAGDRPGKPGQGIADAKPGAGDRTPGKAQRPAAKTTAKKKAGAKVDNPNIRAETADVITCNCAQLSTAINCTLSSFHNHDMLTTTRRRVVKSWRSLLISSEFLASFSVHWSLLRHRHSSLQRRRPPSM